jgi:hypothetical protein
LNGRNMVRQKPAVASSSRSVDLLKKIIPKSKGCKKLQPFLFLNFKFSFHN